MSKNPAYSETYNRALLQEYLVVREAIEHGELNVSFENTGQDILEVDSPLSQHLKLAESVVSHIFPDTTISTAAIELLILAGSVTGDEFKENKFSPTVIELFQIVAEIFQRRPELMNPEHFELLRARSLKRAVSSRVSLFIKKAFDTQGIDYSDKDKKTTYLSYLISKVSVGDQSPHSAVLTELVSFVQNGLGVAEMLPDDLNEIFTGFQADIISRAKNSSNNIVGSSERLQPNLFSLHLSEFIAPIMKVLNETMPQPPFVDYSSWRSLLLSISSNPIRDPEAYLLNLVNNETTLRNLVRLITRGINPGNLVNLLTQGYISPGRLFDSVVGENASVHSDILVRLSNIFAEEIEKHGNLPEKGTFRQLFFFFKIGFTKDLHDLMLRFRSPNSQSNYMERDTSSTLHKVRGSDESLSPSEAQILKRSRCDFAVEHLKTYFPTIENLQDRQINQIFREFINLLLTRSIDDDFLDALDEFHSFSKRHAFLFNGLFIYFTLLNDSYLVEKIPGFISRFSNIKSKNSIPGYFKALYLATPFIPDYLRFKARVLVRTLSNYIPFKTVSHETVPSGD